MNELVKIENGQLAQQTIDYIVEVEQKMKALKEQYDAFKVDLLNAMEQNGVLKFEGDTLRINYVAETTRETFDSTQFKADMPDLYNEYCKISKVKPSVRIKVK